MLIWRCLEWFLVSNAVFIWISYVNHWRLIRKTRKVARRAVGVVGSAAETAHGAFISVRRPYKKARCFLMSKVFLPSICYIVGLGHQPSLFTDNHTIMVTLQTHSLIPTSPLIGCLTVSFRAWIKFGIHSRRESCESRYSCASGLQLATY